MQVGGNGNAVSKEPDGLLDMLMADDDDDDLGAAAGDQWMQKIMGPAATGTQASAPLPVPAQSLDIKPLNLPQPAIQQPLQPAIQQPLQTTTAQLQQPHSQPPATLPQRMPQQGHVQAPPQQRQGYGAIPPGYPIQGPATVPRQQPQQAAPAQPQPSTAPNMALPRQQPQQPQPQAQLQLQQVKTNDLIALIRPRLAPKQQEVLDKAFAQAQLMKGSEGHANLVNVLKTVAGMDALKQAHAELQRPKPVTQPQQPPQVPSAAQSVGLHTMAPPPQGQLPSMPAGVGPLPGAPRPAIAPVTRVVHQPIATIQQSAIRVGPPSTGYVPGQTISVGQQQPPQAQNGLKRAAPEPAAAPASKVQKQSREDDPGDVLQNTGVDLELEEAALLPTMPRSTAAPPAYSAPVQEELCLGHWALLNRVSEAGRAAGVTSVAPQLHRFLSMAAEAHMTGLLQKALRVCRQRAEGGRRKTKLAKTQDVRAGVFAIEKREREKMEAKAAAEREALLKAAASKSKDKDGTDEMREKVQKARQEEADRQQANAANEAALSAFGANAKWANWGARKAAPAAKPSAAAQPASSAAATSDDPKPGGAPPAGTTAPSVADPALGRAPETPALQQPSTAAAAAAPPAVERTMSVADRAGSVAEALLSGRGSLLPPSRMQDEGQLVTLKDLIFTLERDPQYSHSKHLWALYERQGG